MPFLPCLPVPNRSSRFPPVEGWSELGKTGITERPDSFGVSDMCAVEGTKVGPRREGGLPPIIAYPARQFDLPAT